MRTAVELVMKPKRTRFSFDNGIAFYSTKSKTNTQNNYAYLKVIGKDSSNVSEFVNAVNTCKPQKLEGEVGKKKELVRTVETQNGPRKNELNIQMLSENLYRQIFKKNPMSAEKNNSQVIKQSLKQLKQHGVWKDTIDYVKDVNLCLPPLRGENIEAHFWSIGEEQSKPYRDLVLNFIKCKLPEKPKKWLCQKGWTKYKEGKEPVKVPFPNDKILVFDIEVCVKLGDLPTLATAVSESAWYGWVSGDLSEGIDAQPTHFYMVEDLIPLEDTSNNFNKNLHRLVVGHNVSYDRARLKEQYNLKSSNLRFLDTMSLHTCIGGLTKNQKVYLLKNGDDDKMEFFKSHVCLSSLKDVYQMYCNKLLVKEKRSVFLEGTLIDVRNDFDNLMKYCASDVQATFEVLQVIFPSFLERFPHPVTLAGMLEMSMPFLPVTDNWKKYLVEADQTYDDLKNEMSLILSKKSDSACALFHHEKYKTDLWMWNEDWSIQELKLTKKKCSKSTTSQIQIDGKQIDEEDEEETRLSQKFQYLFDQEKILPKTRPFLPGYPQWYRKLCEKSDLNVQPTTGMTIAPKLLHLTWENFPLFYIHNLGWGILVANIFAKNVETSLPFEQLKELTMQNCNISVKYTYSKQDQLSGCKKSNTLKPPFYYKGSGVWCKHIVDNCCYFYKLPHKNGSFKNVGNPLSKDFTQLFSSNFLAGFDDSAAKVIDLGAKLSYWRNNRERIMNQMVVWSKSKESDISDDETSVGIILPKVVVCGTLTRRAMEATWLTASKASKNRIGSELRCLIQAPPGHHIVGADVDSQELWIASLIGDSKAKIHGSTPLGWMALSGCKANGNDLHSVTAKAIGISRSQAKILNYARIYGAGVKFAQKLLQQFNPTMSERQASLKAAIMFKKTKGVRMYKVKKNMEKQVCQYFGSTEICDFASAKKISKMLGLDMSEVFEKSHWSQGTESDVFNQLEAIASSPMPRTPFLSCRLSRALESQFVGDAYYSKTKINWVVQSGAVDFLHLMLVCMKWLTNGQARYCFSFHDDVRFLLPSEKRYDGALALHVTNLLVRAFCSHRLGMRDLPQSVAFFSSVEVDKVLRMDANDDCITPSNPHGMEKGYGIPPGESVDIYEAVNKSGGSLSAFSNKKPGTVLSR